jgi:hypothetical protein
LPAAATGNLLVPPGRIPNAATASRRGGWGRTHARNPSFTRTGSRERGDSSTFHVAL